MLSALRLTWRLTLFILFLVSIILVALALRIGDLFTASRIDRTPVAHHSIQILCGLLGFRLNVHGSVAKGPVLFVSNHISWSDIPVLLACAPLRFLSKSEVSRWPVIGWLAGEAGTLYIKRGGGQSGSVRQQIASVLAGGRSVLIFPEGTTTTGVSVLPFHGRLLAAAADAKCRIQPMTIGYRRNDLPDPVAPFIGDDSFHSHLVRLLSKPALEVEVILHPAIEPEAAQPTEALAQQLHGTVSSGLSQIHEPRRTSPSTQDEGDALGACASLESRSGY